MNLVIPMAFSSTFFPIEEYGYPKPLVEISGKPMLEHVIESLTKNAIFKKIIFVVKQEDCDQFHLDDTIKLLSPIEPIILKLRSDTKGAACSVLLAIDHINDNEPLLIANADQIFDDGIESIVDRFKNDLNDAACATFSSVHPRWSYIKTGHDGLVIEAAEKRPISRNAIAGLYLYKHGSDFCKFAMESIKCSLGIDGSYYISLVFNQYVLAGKKVGHYSIKNDRYHTFYSPQKIEEYELGSGTKVKQ